MLTRKRLAIGILSASLGLVGSTARLAYPGFIADLISPFCLYFSGAAMAWLVMAAR